MANVCSSCKSPIRWVKMESGKRNPLDAEPTAKGNVIVEGGAGQERGVVLSGDELAHARETREPLYLSHFASCPYAATHRRR